MKRRSPGTIRWRMRLYSEYKYQQRKPVCRAAFHRLGRTTKIIGTRWRAPHSFELIGDVLFIPQTQKKICGIIASSPRQVPVFLAARDRPQEVIAVTAITKLVGAWQAYQPWRRSESNGLDSAWAHTEYVGKRWRWVIVAETGGALAERPRSGETFEQVQLPGSLEGTGREKPLRKTKR